MIRGEGGGREWLGGRGVEGGGWKEGVEGEGGEGGWRERVEREGGGSGVYRFGNLHTLVVTVQCVCVWVMMS